MGVAMALVGAMPNGDMKKWLHYQVYTSCFQILGGALSAVITYHDAENKPKQGICVANHTSPIDVLILACDNAYALVRLRLTLFEHYILIILAKKISLDKASLC